MPLTLFRMDFFGAKSPPKSSSSETMLLELNEFRFCCFCGGHVCIDQISKYNNDTSSKILSAIEVLGVSLPNVKKSFQQHQWNDIFFRTQITLDSVVFWNVSFGETKDHSLAMTPFQKNFCYGSFRFVSTLGKKQFSAAPVKCFFFFRMQIT